MVDWIRLQKGLLAASLVAACVAGVSLPSSAEAADITDVLDAFDEHVYGGKVVVDYFDFAIEPTFVQTLTRAKITREANCTGGNERCAEEDTIIYNKELRYERVVNQMDLAFRIGIYKDLEFSVTLPIVFGDTRSVKYAKNAGAACEFDTNPENPKCVDDSNSTVDPSDARIAVDRDEATGDPSPGGFSTYRFFDLPGDDYLDGPTRSGLADIKFRLAWAPFNEERYVDHQNDVWGRKHGRSALALAFEYTAPTADVARNIADNEDVGRGLHGFQFDIATSRRYEYVDPYVGFSFGFFVPSDESLFKDFGGGQDRVGPGPWGEVNLGLEIIPWESVTEQFQQNFKIDIGGTFGYVGEGREQSPLFDAIGSSDCQGLTYNQVNPQLEPDGRVRTGTDGRQLGPARPECGWIAQRWANSGFENVGAIVPTSATFDPDGNQLFDDGTSSYEGYGYFGAHLGLSVQPIQYVSIMTDLSLFVQQEHFMTFGKAGKDIRGREVVDPATGETRPSSNMGKDGTVSFDDIQERNPVYNPVYDAIGSRFRLEEITEFAWKIGLKFEF